MEKKLTNRGPFRKSTRKHSIYLLPYTICLNSDASRIVSKSVSVLAISLKFSSSWIAVRRKTSDSTAPP